MVLLHNLLKMRHSFRKQQQSPDRERIVLDLMKLRKECLRHSFATFRQPQRRIAEISRP